MVKKSAKAAKSDRQAVIDSIRNKQKGAEKRRNFAIVGACSLVAIAILLVAVVPIVREKLELREFNNKDLAAIGAPASVCTDPTTKPADGNQQHEPYPTQITYADESPVAFGPHWLEAGIAPAAFARKFYTAEDRPELESLVHNLEHGYTILWYDETAADDSGTMSQIEALADKFRASDQNFRLKFVAAPWTADDVKESGSFPKGEHIAMTHWSAGGSGETDTSKQVGVFQYCSAPSGAAVEKFMLDYPYTDSPEPNAL